MYQDLTDMHRNHPGPRTWHTIRRRLYPRSLFYGAILATLLYVFHGAFFSEDRVDIEPAEPIDLTDLPSYIWEESTIQVRRAFLHAYHGYEKYAAPNDELKPLTNDYSNKFNGWGVTIFDSLDTMHIMGLHDEYTRALQFVKQANFSFTENEHVPYFETVIRYLGGLLSAYALTHDEILLNRADELAMVLDPVFQTTSGLPLYGVDITAGEAIGPQIGILAEMASLQLEYSYLAKLTGKQEHFTRANNVMRVLEAADLRYTGGMLPIRWNLTSGLPYDSHLSVGAQADSAHEYLLKQYLMTGKSDVESLNMYIRATTYIISKLLYISPTRHLLYVTDVTEGDKPYASHIFEHLSCFLPGLLALGAYALPLDKLDLINIQNGSKGPLSGYDLKKLHLWAAEGLAETCWLTYADQPSGLGPDEVVMKTANKRSIWTFLGSRQQESDSGYLWIDAMSRWKRSGSRGTPPGLGNKKPIIYTEQERRTGRGEGRDYVTKKTEYLLRPETVESLYILWRVTGNPKWRIYGRNIFSAIEKETKTRSGYASLRSVEVSPSPKDDDMPSYFLAETLKYLYLMFINEDPLPLDQWVFNTEAHPFPVFNWSQSEQNHFGI